MVVFKIFYRARIHGAQLKLAIGRELVIGL